MAEDTISQSCHQKSREAGFTPGDFPFADGFQLPGALVDRGRPVLSHQEASLRSRVRDASEVLLRAPHRPVHQLVPAPGLLGTDPCSPAPGGFEYLPGEVKVARRLGSG